METVNFDKVNVHEMRKLAPSYGLKGAKNMSAADLRTQLKALAAERESRSLVAVPVPKGTNPLDIDPNAVKIPTNFQVNIGQETVSVTEVLNTAIDTIKGEQVNDRVTEELLAAHKDSTKTNILGQPVEPVAEDLANAKKKAPNRKEVRAQRRELAKAAAAAAKPSAVKPAKSGKTYVREAGVKYPWSNQAKRVSESAVEVRRANLAAHFKLGATIDLTSDISDGDTGSNVCTTPILAALAEVSEGTMYGRIATQAGRGRLTGTAGPDKKHVWSIPSGLTDEELAALVTSLIK
jgi:hypothetical protein